AAAADDAATVLRGAGPSVSAKAQTDPRASVRAASMAPRNLRGGATGWVKTRPIPIPEACILTLTSRPLYGTISATRQRSGDFFEDCSKERGRSLNVACVPAVRMRFCHVTMD